MSRTGLLALRSHAIGFPKEVEVLKRGGGGGKGGGMQSPRQAS